MNYPLNNQVILGGGEPLDSSNFINFVNFNGFNLNDCGDIVIKNTNYLDLGDIDFKSYNSPFQDGGGVLSSYMTQKTITFEIFIKKDTSDELFSFIDEFKRETNKQEARLLVDFGGLRYTYATLTNLVINRDPANPKRLESVEVTFISKTPHFIALEPKAFTELVTTNSHPLDLNNIGSEETFANFNIVCNVGTAISKIVVVNNGYNLEITTNLVAGDVLEIDGENKLVRKNTVIIDYDGIFNELKMGSNPMQINFIGTVNISVSSYFLLRYR